MKLEVTELGPNKRALKIEVPEDEVNRQFTQAYVELNRQVRIPGFRPGKAPLSLLEKRYAKVIEEDLIRKLIPDYYDKAVRQAGFVAVQVEVPPLERAKIKKNAPFSFTATVEIKPSIELRDYKAPNPISLKPDKRVVTDEQVAQALDVLREQHAQLQAAPPGTALGEGDYAVLDVEGFVDSAPLEGAKKEGHLHKIGSKTPVLGIEVDQALLGKKEGESVEVPQPYQDTHPDPQLAGKTVVFRMAIKAVKQKKLAALDDEFAKDCGPYSSLEELKAKLRGEMEATLKRDIEESYKDQILKRLVETHHFDLPDTLVERELTAAIRQHMESRMRQRGKIDQAEDLVKQQEEIKKLREELLPESTRRVKLGLILEAIAEKEGIKVEEADVAAELERLAKRLKLTAEDIRRMVESAGQDMREELFGRILAEKSLDFVYRHAMIQG
ncbi:trigger factor [Nitrospira sp. Nam74]